MAKQTRGERLWEQITEAHTLDPAQLVILEEACRSADRLDDLDEIIRGKGVLDLLRFRLRDTEGRVAEVKFDAVLGEARQQQNVMKQLLVSLRLPDATTGQRPQARGSRGAYAKGATRADKLSGLRAIAGGKAEETG